MQMFFVGLESFWWAGCDTCCHIFCLQVVKWSPSWSFSCNSASMLFLILGWMMLKSCTSLWNNLLSFVIIPSASESRLVRQIKYDRIVLSGPKADESPSAASASNIVITETIVWRSESTAEWKVSHLTSNIFFSWICGSSKIFWHFGKLICSWCRVFEIAVNSYKLLLISPYHIYTSSCLWSSKSQSMCNTLHWYHL